MGLNFFDTLGKMAFIVYPQERGELKRFHLFANTLVNPDLQDVLQEWFNYRLVLVLGVHQLLYLMHLLSKEGLALGLEIEALEIGKANLKH